MWQRIFTVLRDAVCLTSGVTMFVIEGLKDRPSAMLLVVYVIVATSPGAFAAHWLGKLPNASTALPSSPSVPQSSPPAPPSSQSGSSSS